MGHFGENDFDMLNCYYELNENYQISFKSISRLIMMINDSSNLNDAFNDWNSH